MVSVVLPNYNHALFLRRRIDSILNQTYQDFELIILDDCSTDGSRKILEIIKSNSKVSKIVFNEKNSCSPFKQWQKGISLAKGEWIWIAESDDWCEDSFLEKLVSFMEQHNNLGLVYSQTNDVIKDGKSLQSRIIWTSEFENNIWKNDFCIPGADFIKYLYVKNVIPNVSASLIRKDLMKSIFKKNPGIENMKMTGDWFCWILLAGLPGIKIGFVCEHLNFFRDTVSSSRQHNSFQKKINRILEEAKIFNSGNILIDSVNLKKKNKDIINKWNHLFLSEGISFDIFRICNEIPISRITLLKKFLKLKFNK